MAQLIRQMAPLVLRGGVSLQISLELWVAIDQP